MKRELRRTFRRYRVCGDRAFREHGPGTEFVAALDPGQEARAVRRSSIEILEDVDLSLESVPRTLPSGWIAEIPQERNERGAGTRRLTTLEREVTSGVL